MDGYDVLVVGAGPAGVAAAMTLARGGRSVLLVDDAPPMITYANRSLRELIQLYISNHGAYISSVEVDNAVNRKILTGKIKTTKTGKKVTVYTPIDSERDYQTRTNPNDTIWSLIVDQARRVGAHAWMSAQGTIVVSRPNYEIDPDIYGKGIWDTCDAEGNITGSNYINLAWTPSIADRASHYVVVGQGAPKTTALGAELSEHYSQAIDPSPGFHINSGGALQARLTKKNIDSVRSLKNKGMVQRVARQKMEFAAIEGYSLTVTVAGHRPFEGGPIYSVDTMISVSSNIWGIMRPHYIIGRKLDNDTSGMTTTLRLIPPEIWLPTGGTDSQSEQAYLAAKAQQIDW